MRASTHTIARFLLGQVFLGGALCAVALAYPPCGKTPREKPYPCDAGRGYTWLVGPVVSYRGGSAGHRAHAGAEVSMVTGRLQDDGAHDNFRSHVLGVALATSYLSHPNAFHATLEGLWAHPMFLWGGISAGPSLTVDGAGARAGAVVTAWWGFGIALYGRFGADFPWSPYGEVGLMLKFPFTGGGCCPR